jgi:hypothetical protein
MEGRVLEKEDAAAAGERGREIKWEGEGRGDGTKRGMVREKERDYHRH